MIDIDQRRAYLEAFRESQKNSCEKDLVEEIIGDVPAVSVSTLNQNDPEALKALEEGKVRVVDIIHNPLDRSQPTIVVEPGIGDRGKIEDVISRYQKRRINRFTSGSNLVKNPNFPYY